MGIILFTISVLVRVYDETTLYYRGMRGVVSVVYFVFLILINKKNTSTLLSVFLLVYALSSFLTVWYEIGILATLSLGLNFVALLALIFYMPPKVQFKNINIFFAIIFIIFLLVIGFLLFGLVDMIKDFSLNSAHYGFMLLVALNSAILCFLTIIYNHQKSSKGSLIFTIFVVLLVFSEVFRAIAYYDLGYGVYGVYLARILLIMSNALLIHYTVINEGEKIDNAPRYL